MAAVAATQRRRPAAHAQISQIGEIGPIGAIGVASVAVTLPLWTVSFPPMVDYPQQLALAAILRWYGDPVRRFAATYEIWWTAPHALWKLLVAGLAWIMPIEVAGKLVVALSLAAVGPAAFALCRRAGRPGWYALAALALVYNYAFSWGFVDNLLAYPLVLAGVALADRLLAERASARSWLLLAGMVLLFYTVHLQMLAAFAGAVGWLALVRLPRPGRLAFQLSALVPALLLATAMLARSGAGAGSGSGTNGEAHSPISRYEMRMRAVPTVLLAPAEKAALLPKHLFGGHPDATAGVLFLLWLALWPAAGRGPAEARRDEGEEAAGAAGAPRGEPASAAAPAASWRERLERSRFATLAAWLGLLYFVLPESSWGYLIAARMAPLAAMVGVAALPCRNRPGRRLVALLAGGLVVLQLGATEADFLRFERESRGLATLLAATAPGENLAGLIYHPDAVSRVGAPVLLHMPAYYQVEKGGRVLFSFAELYHLTVKFRPGQSWDDLLAEWDDWNPQGFSYPRHAARFRYFLVRGTSEELSSAFGSHLAELRVRSAGAWFLVERPAPSHPPEQPPRRQIQKLPAPG